ncbi:MAG: TonB-dependent receptor [Gemmatimonadota bacterium]
MNALVEFLRSVARPALLLVGISIAGIGWPLAAQAQSEGRIVGRAVSAQNGEPLSNAQVFVVGTGIGTLSSLDGRFVLRSVPAGTMDVRVELLGFADKTITGVVVRAGETITLDVSMEPEAIALEALVVTAEAERGNTVALITERQKAPVVVDAIGSDQISRSPDGDAAAALRRVPGLSVVDGKYAYVRGLGERYSSTTLNGSPLASPVPDKKVIPLDVIPSSMLESIVTAKSYSPDQPGDYAGGLVQLRTKDFPAFRIFNVSLSSSYNSVASLKDGLGYAGGGYDFLGFDDGTRDLPALLPRDRAVNRANFSPADLQAIGQAFGGAWGPSAQALPVNESFGVSFGDEFELLGRSFGFLASVNQSSDYGVQANLIERAFGAGGGGEPDVDYTGDVTTHSVSLGALVNLSYELAPTHRLTINGVYNRLTDDAARSLEGFNLDSNTDQRNTRIQYVEQTLTNAQLRGQHEFGGLGNVAVDWRTALTRAERYEPNTRESLYREFNGQYFWDDFIQSGSVFHQDMVDDGLSGGINVKVPFAVRGLPASFQLGASADRKERDAYSRRFRFRPQGSDINSDVRTLEPDDLFQPQYISPTGFEIQEATFRTDNYTASEDIDAAYAMIDAEILPRLRLVGGARFEQSKQVVSPQDLFPQASQEPLAGADVDRSEILPSINLTLELTDAMNLRGSASRTLARPQLRELAPFSFADYAGGFLVVGNPELTISRIQNYDLRWEWFFQPGALIAVSGFYKRFQDPIEVQVLPSTELIKTWVNAPSAKNYGTEIELRAPLTLLADAFEGFTANANVTLVQSEVAAGGLFRYYLPGVGAQELDVQSRSRALQGQSPYVVNAGLTYYNDRSNTTATVLFNRFGRRIDAVNREATPNIYEEARSQLDLVFEQKLRDNLALKLSAARLLGNQVDFTQGEDLLRAYDMGRSFSIALKLGN